MRVFLLAAVAALLLGLSACGDSETITLNIYNWGYFHDPAIERIFYEETGIRLNVEFYSSNQIMYNRIVNQGAEFDVLFPSDYMIERLIAEGRLAPLNWDNIPNAQYLHHYFHHLEFDPQGRYAVAYKWGKFGILYNTTMVYDPVYSWGVLWDERYAGEIYMYYTARDSLGAALKYLGFSQNTTNLAELHAARDLLIAQAPLRPVYSGDQIRPSMVNRGRALATIFSGCAWFAMYQNPELNFVVPVEGTQFFIDAMVIPNTTRHQAEAEKFINFMMRPDIALMNAEWVMYSTTNAAALEKLPEEWRNSQVFWPTGEVFERGEAFRDVGEFREEFYNAFMTVLVAVG